MTRHALERKRERCPRAATVSGAIPIPARVMRDILGLHRKKKRHRRKRKGEKKVPRKSHRTKYRATATGVYVLAGGVVVTVYPLTETQLADLLWWALTGSVVPGRSDGASHQGGAASQ